MCNRRHSIDQQLCRWLLLSLDRLESDELTMTHEVLANTLGVRREGITEAARKLHNVGLINYRRGRITVIDRVGVEAYCCECYSVVRGEYDRLPGRMPIVAADCPRGARQWCPQWRIDRSLQSGRRMRGEQPPLFRLVARNIGRDVGDVVGAQRELLRVLDVPATMPLICVSSSVSDLPGIALELMAGRARALRRFSGRPRCRPHGREWWTRASREWQPQMIRDWFHRL